MWAKRAVDEWTTAAAIKDGAIFRRVNRLGKIWGDGITPKAIWHIVKAAAKRGGIRNLAPHGLRRYAEFRNMPHRVFPNWDQRLRPRLTRLCSSVPMRHSQVWFTGFQEAEVFHHPAG
jgi:integrase